MERKEQEERTLSPKEKLGELLARFPSGPSFTQSTIVYCDECIEGALARINQGIIRQYPTLEDNVAWVIDKIAHKEYIPSAASDFSLDGQNLYILTPKGNKLRTISILQSVFSTNPRLGVFEYAIGMYAPRNKQDMRGHFPWFDSRFRKIVEIGKLSLDNPMAQIIAVGYLTQVAKIRAINHSKELAKKALSFGGITTPEKIVPYLKETESKVERLRSHQAFIGECLATIKRIAQENSLDDDQIQLLLDLAFIRNRAFDRDNEFNQVFEPLIKLITIGNWEEAYKHQKFLLKYFSDSFPDWRKREYQRKDTGLHFNNFRELAEAMRIGSLTLTQEEIPAQYQPFLIKAIPKKLERARKEHSEQIYQQSIKLSLVITKKIAEATRSMLFINKLQNRFGQKAEGIIKCLSTNDQNIGFERFSDLLKRKRHNSLISDETEFSLLKDQFQELESPAGPPYILRKPQEVRVLDISLHERKIVYRYQTDRGITKKDKQGHKTTVWENYDNFGQLVADLILASQKPPSTNRPVLPAKTLKKIIKQAWEREVKRNQKLAAFTLTQYLKAIIPQEYLNEDSPISTFISSSEENSLP